jgi:hypothetical protein
MPNIAIAAVLDKWFAPRPTEVLTCPGGRQVAVEGLALRERTGC